MIHFVEVTRAIKVDDGGQGVEESLLNRCRIEVWKCRKARVNTVTTTEQFPKEYRDSLNVSSMTSQPDQCEVFELIRKTNTSHV